MDEKRGPKNRDVVKKMRLKLFEMLKRNAETLEYLEIPKHQRKFNPLQKKPVDVEELLARIQADSSEKLTRRSLYSWLRALRTLGLCSVKAKNRHRYYCLTVSSTSALLWKEILEPSLNFMEVTDVLMNEGSFILGKEEKAKNEPQRLVGLSYKTAVIEAGINITSEQHDLQTGLPRDIMGNLFNHLEFAVRRELYLHYGVTLREHTHPTAFAELSNKKLEELEEQLKGRQLAVIFLLDGSEIIEHNLPPEDEKAFEKWWKEKLDKKHKKPRQMRPYLRQVSK